MKVRYTTRALTDLHDIEHYLRTQSPKGAARIGARIRKRIDDLVLIPLQGSPRPRKRRLLVITRTPYIAFYRVVGEEVQIITILHGSRKRRS